MNGAGIFVIRAADVRTASLEGEVAVFRHIGVPSVVGTMLHIVQERYKEQGISLSLIQSEIHLSRRHLGRLFRRYTGRSFHQYLDDVRTRMALSLLQERRYGIKAVAAMVGFASRSQFHHDFRTRIGCTPAQFVAAASKWQDLAASFTHLDARATPGP